MQITKREFLKKLGLAGAAGVTGEAAGTAPISGERRQVRNRASRQVTGTVLFIR